MNKIIGTYDWATSNTWTPTEEDRIHLGNDVSGTILASGNHNGVIEDNNMNDVEVCDFRYDEGLRDIVDTQIVPTLTTHTGGGISSGAMLMENANVKDVIKNGDTSKKLRIRKLTAKECWRLQGFDDEDYDKAAKVNSESQLYKQAGNSIAVPCLTGIITNIFNVDRESK